jgi:hypothetical protein
VPPYELRKHDHSNEWAVIDTATGEIARENGILQAGLSIEQANAVADRLNKLEHQISGTSR